jgi:hypothetical protein
MKRGVFLALVLILAVLPAIALAAEVKVEIKLTPAQLALLKASPTKEVKIELTADQIAAIVKAFPKFKGAYGMFKFAHVFENEKISVVVMEGKLLSTPGFLKIKS